MRQADELIVINRILSQTAYRNSHSVFKIYIQRYLGTVVLLQILNKLLRCAGQLSFLRKSLKAYQTINQLLFGWLFTEFYKYGSCMSV